MYKCVVWGNYRNYENYEISSALFCEYIYHDKHMPIVNEVFIHNVIIT